MYEPNDPASYLASDEVIDAHDPAVAGRAHSLAADGGGQFDTVRRCFEWVSNHVPHSLDCGAEAVPCTAGEVLAAGHGLCYAKSHLLAALLRANEIPAGFDYQRLRDNDGGYALHGLNTVHLAGCGWFRLDSRGRADVATRLTAPRDLLRFSAAGPGEVDYRLNLAAPLPEVVRRLRNGKTLAAVLEKLPRSVVMG